MQNSRKPVCSFNMIANVQELTSNVVKHFQGAGFSVEKVPWQDDERRQYGYLVILNKGGKKHTLEVFPRGIGVYDNDKGTLIGEFGIFHLQQMTRGELFGDTLMRLIEN